MNSNSIDNKKEMTDKLSQEIIILFGDLIKEI
jgi:hypothetical protein